MSSKNELIIVAFVLYVVGMPIIVNWFNEWWQRKVSE